MKLYIIISVSVLGIFLSIAQGLASIGPSLIKGEVEVLYNLDAGTSPEGIAVDRNGNMLIGVRTHGAAGFAANDVIKITPLGEIILLASLGPSSPEGDGLLGLTTDPKGNVYAAFSSENENHGVWKICPDGESYLLSGSEQIILPNAITLDSQGNVYVTDSNPHPEAGGAVGVWRYGKTEGFFEPWCSDEPVLADEDDPRGFPLVGANGIAYGPPNNIYVANTEKDLIAHITVLDDGSAGEAYTLALPSWMVINPDGLAMDTKGDIYAVLPVSTFPESAGLPPLSPVIKIHVETCDVEPILHPVSFPDGEFFDFPTSLVFGTGPMDKKSLYVISRSGMESYGFPSGTGAKVTQVGVGVPGRTGQ